MPSVHYKFKSSLDYKTLMFEGIQISVGELKKLIYENEKIGKSADFDLQITNAQTKQVYEDESSVVQRNASVIVARVPTAVQQKLPKVWDTRTEGKVNRNPTVSQPTRASSSLFPGNDLASNSELTEDEKLKLMQHEATQDYDPSQYQRGRQVIKRGPAPSTLRCNRCGQTGDHWIKDCPLLNVRRPTGIPKDELMETTPDDPQAMLTPGGRYVVPIMDKQAHLIGKKERPPFFDEEAPIVEPEPKKDIPSELMCPLCSDLLREAVVISCCGYSFCDDCIRNRLLESDYHQCPHCSEKGISPDSLVPNSQLRKAVTNFRNETGYIYAKHQAPIKSRPDVATQAPTTTASRLKINLVSASIARANAAGQKLRVNAINSDATSSPGPSMTGSTQSPDTRERSSPAMASGVLQIVGSSTAVAAPPPSSSYTSAPSRSASFNKAPIIPAVRFHPSAPPAGWPPISMSAPIASAPAIHMGMPPMGPTFLPSLPPAMNMIAPVQPMMPYPQQQQMSMPGPPGVQQIGPPAPFHAPPGPFMTSQPPPPGVPSAMPNIPGPVVTSAYVVTRPTTYPPPRRPLTEAEFYDAKRRMLENRFHDHRQSPRPQDAWEEFLARKDRKRRRSHSRSSHSSSRSRSRSSERSRRSRSRSVTRSPSRSPSYHSHRRPRRGRSRNNYSRSRGRSRSRTPPPHSRQYNRRARRSRRPNSRNRNRIPSSAAHQKRSSPKHHTHEASSSQRRASSTDLASAVSNLGADKRSTLASSIGYSSVAPQPTERTESPVAQLTTTASITIVATAEPEEKLAPSEQTIVKEEKVEASPNEEKQKAKEDTPVLEEKKDKSEKPPKDKASKAEKATKGSKSRKEETATKESTAANEENKIAEETEPPKVVKEEPSPVATKESSVPKEEPVSEDDKTEKKKKAKKEKKKKRKHHRHKTPKKKHGAEETEDERKDKNKSKESSSKEKSASKEKSLSKDEKPKLEKREKSSSQEKRRKASNSDDKEKKTTSEGRSEKKEKKHKSQHKKEKRKSDAGLQSEGPAKKKRRE